MTIASLAMYPFPQLQPAYDELWDHVRARLPLEAPSLDWGLDPDLACRRDDLLLGQTCGWPLVKYLVETVRVVGTFDCHVPDAVDGTYRSVLVSSVDDSLPNILQHSDLRVAANSVDSLSGWISMQTVAAAHGVELKDVLWTGSHAASIEAVRNGRCRLASIDAVSWVHLGGHGLTVVGSGPRTPCLPLVTAASSSDALLGQLRAGLSAAVGDPALADVCDTLKIRAFVERDLANYEGLSESLQLW
ncbi:MAG: PhnD/SsuA/transferrin family substrate-binding protein [Ilumatobacteraceae bacterium]